MLDFADVIAINKFDRKGAEDAYRDVCKQVQRNREAFAQNIEEMPVFGTIASRFNDDGTTALYQEVMRKLGELGLSTNAGTVTPGRHPQINRAHRHRTLRAGALSRRNRRNST